MKLKKITLLSKKEYEQFERVIPLKRSWWWLKTPRVNSEDRVYAVEAQLYVSSVYCADNYGGVRPVCVFTLEYTDDIFWTKAEKLIGAKAHFGQYGWTVYNAKDGDLYMICDDIIHETRFDDESNIWEVSELKNWIDKHALSRITRQGEFSDECILVKGG